MDADECKNITNKGTSNLSNDFKCKNLMYQKTVKSAQDQKLITGENIQDQSQ